MVLLIMSQESSCFSSMSLLFSIHVMTVDGTPIAFIKCRLCCYSQSLPPPPLSLSLSHVCHILKLALNLTYVGKLWELGNLVIFSSCCCYVQDLLS